MKDRLIGTWRLVSYETDEQGGKRGNPYGDAVGRLAYDEHGNMSGQVMRPGRAHVELGDGGASQVRAAYLGYIAYFGTYEVRPDGKSVVHHVQGSLNPGWVGGQQVRAMRFDADQLVLSADVRKNGDTVTHTLTWQKC